MISSRRSLWMSLPSTLTWSRSPGCVLKSVQTWPLIVTRPAAINSSQCRREPSPAAARKRLRRTVRARGLNVRLGFRQADDFLALLELAALFQKFDALETFQDVSLRRNGAG